PPNILPRIIPGPHQPTPLPQCDNGLFIGCVERPDYDHLFAHAQTLSLSSTNKSPIRKSSKLQITGKLQISKMQPPRPLPQMPAGQRALVSSSSCFPLIWSLE